MVAAVRLMRVNVIEAEVEAQVGAKRCQRSPVRRDHRIGHRPRTLGTRVGLIEELPVPRTRQGFVTERFEKYQRRQVELDRMIGDMFIRGISQAAVGQALERLNG